MCTALHNRSLYLVTTVMCLVHWFSTIGIFLQVRLCFMNSVTWVTIKPMGLANRTRVPGDKDHHPLSVLTEARGERSGSSWSPTPLRVKLWEICGIPGWAQQKSVSDSLNVITWKACKGMNDLVISQRLMEKLSHSPAINCH